MMATRQLAHYLGVLVTAWVTLASPLPIPFDIAVGTLSGVLTVGIVVLLSGARR